MCVYNQFAIIRVWAQHRLLPLSLPLSFSLSLCLCALLMNTFSLVSDKRTVNAFVIRVGRPKPGDMGPVCAAAL